jgi:tetratricopeptide (TPR) repeat protein
MLGAPSPGEVTPRLRAARQNASIMASQIQFAYIEYMRSLASLRPTLLLLEDLHWGDEPSVKLVDIALRELSHLPFAVVAFARPDVHDVFPKLWRGRESQEIRLSALPRRAAAQMVKNALGDSIRESTISNIVERAGGNAFYLEELIRAAAEGRPGGLPETILGMVEARLSSLPPDCRRVLRAASVFGKVFWKRAVQDLLGESGEYGGGARFEDLVEQELFVRHADSRFPGEEEYAFRHTLIREGAYAMLTDRDRVLAHKRAAEWLEQAGETDAMTLAAHYERGEETIRAGEFYLRAAELAHRAGDTAASMSRAKRGLSCGVPSILKLDLLGLLSELHIWRNEWGVAAGYGADVFRLAQPGSTSWIRAATARLVDAMNQGEIDQALSLVDAICEARPGADSIDPAALALALGVVFLVTLGRAAEALRLLDRLHALVEPFHDTHPTARAWMHLAHPRLEAWIHEDPVAGLSHSEAAQQSFREAHYERGERLSRVFIGMNTWRLGNREAAERALRQEVSTEAEFALVASLHSVLLSLVLAAGGKIEEAKSEALRLIETGWSRRVASDEGRGHWAMAEALMCEGDLEGAEREAESAVRMLAKLPLDQAAATATLAVIRLKRGDGERALEAALRAAVQHGALEISGYRGALTRLTLAECLHVTGNHAWARSAIAAARDLLLRNAGRIPDPEQRQRFLEEVPENRRTLELARAWLEN